MSFIKKLFLIRQVNLIKSGGANVILRIITLASKFLFFTYIGKELSVIDMGVYGLFTTTLSISITILGFQFSSYSTREILARTGQQRVLCIRDQFVFYALTYIVFLPLALFIFVFDVLPWNFIFWFYLLVILEHIVQESVGLFNTLFRPVFAGILYFFRAGVWVYLFIGLSVFQKQWLNLETVFVAWSLGLIISVSLSYFELQKLDWSLAKTTPINWKWIKNGLLTVRPFIASAIAYRIVEVSDRYLIHFMLSDSDVGVYTFFATLVSVIPTIVYAGVTAILVPRVLHAYQTGQHHMYTEYYRYMVLSVTLLLVAGLPIMLFVVDPILLYVDKVEYTLNLSVYRILLISSAATIFSSLTGIGLYARKDDMALFYAVILAAASNIILNLIFIPPWGIEGAAWSTAFSYTIMGCFQFLRLRKATP